MDNLTLVAPCHFGVESVLKREILDLGYEIIKVEDGRITYKVTALQFADQTFFCGRQNVF